MMFEGKYTCVVKVANKRIMATETVGSKHASNVLFNNDLILIQCRVLTKMCTYIKSDVIKLPFIYFHHQHLPVC